MQNELGIEVCCKNCKQCTDNGNGCGIMEMSNDFIFGTRHCAFSPSKEAYEARIKELQEIEFENKLEKSHLQKEIEKAYNFISKLREKLQEQQFTKKEAEKIETFLTHGYQMMINENKEIFSKLEKMKGENNEQ